MISLFLGGCRGLGDPPGFWGGATEILSPLLEPWAFPSAVLPFVSSGPGARQVSEVPVPSVSPKLGLLGVERIGISRDVPEGGRAVPWARLCSCSEFGGIGAVWDAKLVLLLPLSLEQRLEPAPQPRGWECSGYGNHSCFTGYSLLGSGFLSISPQTSPPLLLRSAGTPRYGCYFSYSPFLSI